MEKDGAADEMDSEEPLDPEKTTLVIENMEWWTSERELREMGSPYGTITSVRFKENRQTGKSLCVATVVFDTAKGARDAKEHIESREYSVGKTFKVTIIKDNK